MTDPNGHSTDPQAAAEAAAQAAPAADPAALAKEAADYKDRLLRTLAEMENLRRRTEREVADTRALRGRRTSRATCSPSPTTCSARSRRCRADSATRPIRWSRRYIEGVELTERELMKVLEKHGVKRFDPQGQKFDPNLHQAMFEVPDPSVPAGTVVQVMQPGYMIGDRVLRPALVGVSKGGPKAAPAANENATQPGSVDTEA